MQRIAFLLASVAGSAALAAPNAVFAAGVPAQGASNENIRQSIGQIDEVIAELKLDDDDYAGHRVAAISALEHSRDALLAALAARRALDRSNGGSKASIQYANRVVASVTATLQGDDTDYAGHRIEAIVDLQKASAELGLALKA